jgi:murein L,D-transpeptidase YafK
MMSIRHAAAIVSAGLLLLAATPAERPRRAALRADAIIVEKAKRTLTLLSHGHPLRTYRVALGPSPTGHKQCEGDGRTPEGRYVIDSRLRASSYHRALHVSYPNAHDVASARRRGCRPGGGIMIHGLPNGHGYVGKAHRLVDWTAGCVAVTDEEIEEIWSAVPDGTSIEIRP